MEYQGYGKQINNMIERFPYGNAFNTGEIAQQLAKETGILFAQAKALTNNKLKRMADQKQIERLDKGVYFRVKQTPFGVVRPNPDNYAIQLLTLKDGKRIGYESGAAFLNRLGLTTLVPKNIELATNAYRKKLPEGCAVTARKPVTEITNKNYLYLQFLDAVNELPKAHVDALNPEEILKDFAKQNGLDALTIIALARNLYPQNTLIKSIDILLGGRTNDFA